MCHAVPPQQTELEILVLGRAHGVKVKSERQMKKRYCRNYKKSSHEKHHQLMLEKDDIEAASWGLIFLFNFFQSDNYVYM